MVHGLETIKKLNEKPLNGKNRDRKPDVPPEFASKPLLARAFTNRPWTKEELGSQPDVYESYAKSAKAPFRPEGGQREGLRT